MMMDILYFSGNEYTNVFGSNSFDGSLTPYIHNIFKPDVKTCILDGEMLLYHPESKTFGKLCTVKFLNFRMPENFAEIYLKFKERGIPLGVSSKRCKWKSKQWRP